MTIHLISYIHSGLSFLEEITPLFSPLKIYIPWGGIGPECVDNKKIFGIYPPEEFKPETDFNLLLDECFNWVYEQGEKSRKEIIKTGHIDPTSNESLRHIKTILASRTSDTSEKDMIFRWHLLLHLANRLEEHRNEANRMIEDLKKKPSPLLHNADLTENTQYPLENLTGIDPEFLLNDYNIKMLSRAWHGLFSSLIDEADMLLTIDRRIFDYLSAECDILCNNHGLKKSDVISFKSPLFKRQNRNSEKPHNDIAIGDDIRNIVISDIKQEDKALELTKLTEGFESIFEPEIGVKYILFSILLFQPSEKSVVKNDPFLKFLSGRTLIFAQLND